MFFSVIIPTYNPGKYLMTMLDSITHNECLEDIEVIISDDCSTENFDDTLDKYDTLTIRKIVNKEHYGFPKQGRQNGADAAQGEWICFADQDDYFVDGAFDDIKEHITQKNLHNCLFTNFVEESAETGDRILRGALKGWTHGKFYEKKFWDKYNIGYDDVRYCEDINLSTKIDCITCVYDITNNVYDKPIYIWRRRSDSLANIDYYVNSMPDYVNATIKVLVDYVEKYQHNEKLFVMFNAKFISALLNIYFCFQSDLLNCKKEVMLKTVLTIQPYFTKFKKITGFSNIDLVYFINTDLREMYNQVRTDNYSQVPFVEQILFGDWLEAYFD